MKQSITDISPNPHLAIILKIATKIQDKIGKDNFAYSLISVSALAYPLCFVYGSSHKIHPVEMNLIRGVTTFVTHILLLRFLGMDLDFKSSRNNKYLIIRNVIMLVNQITYTAMHYVVPLPVINILNISGSIFAFVVDYALYGTVINRRQVVGFAIGCLGLMLTVGGEYVMSMFDQEYVYETRFENYFVDSQALKLLFCGLYILASLLWAFGLVIQKQIKNVSGLKINYHLSIVFTLSTATVYPVAITSSLSMSEFLMGCAISGLLMAFVQILFTTAFNVSSNSGILTMLTMLTVVTSYFISIIVYGESVNLVCFLGLVLLGLGLRQVISNSGVQSH